MEISDVSAYEAAQGLSSDATTVGSSASVTDTSYSADGANVNISTVVTGSEGLEAQQIAISGGTVSVTAPMTA